MADTQRGLPPLSHSGGGMTIRAYTTQDADALADAVNESYNHLKPWIPWAREDQTVKESEQICRQIMKSFYGNEDYTLGIWDDDRLVGGTGFHMRCGPVEWKCSEVGMWIRSSCAEQGWGTRVLEQMIEWGFGEWGWERLIWKCDTRNIGSKRVAEKCGLTLEATFRSDALDVEGNRCDTHQYVILKPDWLKR